MTNKNRQEDAGRDALPGTAPPTDAGTLAGVGDSAFAAEAAALGDVTGSVADAAGTISGTTVPADGESAATARSGDKGRVPGGKRNK